MIDNGCFGDFWRDIANDEFDIGVFREEIDKLPNAENIQSYLKELSERPVDEDKMVYHYLLLQAGSFGSKQIWIEENKWKNNSFRSYWTPTKTSNRKSHVNPMMPMPDTLYDRVENIVNSLSGCIVASKEDVFKVIYRLEEEQKNGDNNIIIYIDPPYSNTTGYKENFDIYELKKQILSTFNNLSVYISEAYEMNGVKSTYLLSSGRLKGNISGETKKTPVEEWLNRF